MMQPPPPEDEQLPLLDFSDGSCSTSEPRLSMLDLVEQVMRATGERAWDDTPRVKPRRRRRS